MRRCTVLAAGLCLSFAAVGCAGAADTATVEGPEADDLAGKLRGHIVTNDSGDITVVTLPANRSHLVRRLPRTADGMGPVVHALSGPDREGRIAYIEDYFFVATEKEKRHILKAVRADGTADTEIFSRRGDAMWATSAAGKGEIGSHLSLAPMGGRVAFISQVKGRQMERALLHAGRMEIWSLSETTGRDTNVLALDEPMSWFADGKRIAYSMLARRKDLPPDAAGLKEFGNYFGELWEEIPAIYFYDLDADESEFFCVGWQAVVASDGESILVGGWGGEEFSWLRVDIETRRAAPLELPGGVGSILGTAPGMVVYIGLPTEGAATKVTENNSPLRGPKPMWTIKVCDDAGETFQTIVPYIDPRSAASFGAGK